MKNIFITAILLTTLVSNGQSIYTSNGTLTSTRTVTLGGFNLTFQGTSGQLFMNGSTGNIGLGTTLPAEKLDINGNIQAKIGYFTNSLTNGQTFTNTTDRNLKCRVLSAGTLLDASAKDRTLSYYDFPQSNIDTYPEVHLSINDRGYYTRLRFFAKQNSSSQFILSDKSQIQNFVVKDDGNNNISLIMPKANSFVGIGTTSFADGADIYHLSVNGNIRAHRVKVYTTWADYVFEDDYQLPTLDEVEAHIKDKGHLKDVPSAAQVEANGIELGEMNKILLQKIEELTLYTIEQNKINQQQAKQIEELSTLVKALSEKK